MRPPPKKKIEGRTSLLLSADAENPSYATVVRCRCIAQMVGACVYTRNTEISSLLPVSDRIVKCRLGYVSHDDTYILSLPINE